MITEKVTIGEGSEWPLSGLLTLPDGDGPFPAVVMVHGSGPSNMDEKVMAITPFKDLAEGLAAKGVASVRYDKRTFTYARKMARLSPTVKEETIDDAVLAAQLLKEDARVDSGRVFILGHSMGAMLASRIDAEGADARGLILMAGTPYRLEEVVLKQLKQSGGSSSVLKWITGLEYKIFSKKFAGLYEMSDEEARKKKFAGSLTLYYFKEMGQKTAADYLLENEKPALILQGGKDFQVLLAGRPNTVFKLYPGLNHVFVEAIYSDIMKAKQEYSTERHIGDEVISDIAEFVKKS